jgi:predicted dehydrogenase
MSDPNITVACLGAGAWGKNQIRVFSALPHCQLKYIGDVSRPALERMKRAYPQVLCTSDPQEVFADPEVQAVVITTPAPTHYEMAKKALEAGKDVFIEKPMVLDPAHGEELIALAQRKSRLIQVGHLLLFHPAVLLLKRLVDSGELGALHYIYTQRLNLGTVRSDENALWSLAPHDLSLANYLLNASPARVSCSGACYLQKHIEDVVFLDLAYPDGRIVHVHVSWLDPHKTRRITLVGSKKMAVFDDMEPVDKVRIYDKGIAHENYETFQESFGIRNGDILIPSISSAEPLRLQAEHFIECVANRIQPLVSGKEGLSVVHILRQADECLAKHRNRPQPVSRLPSGEGRA